MSDAPQTRYELVSGRSAVLIEARSSVGPITFGTTNVTGWVGVTVRDGIVDIDGAPPTGSLSIELSALTSGNKLYDAELLHRIDVRRHPVTTVDLGSAASAGRPGQYQLTGDLSFHGVTREISGWAGVTLEAGGLLRVVGEHVFDIRDFDVAAPTVLMLRIYPDVRVELQLEAAPVV